MLDVYVYIPRDLRFIFIWLFEYCINPVYTEISTHVQIAISVYVNKRIKSKTEQVSIGLRLPVESVRLLIHLCSYL